MGTRGIRDVPNNIDPQLRDHLQDMRAVLLQIQGQITPPRPVINLGAFTQPVAVLIQWTTTDANGYTVFWNDSPTLDLTKSIDAGAGSSYVDHIGQAGVTRWYWVRAYKTHGSVSNVVGPVSATAGAIGTGVPPPIAPVQGDQFVIDQTTGFPVPRGPIKKGP